MAGAGAVALAASIVQPRRVRGAEANSQIRLGVIGCGKRMVFLASLFEKHGGFRFVSLADYFTDRVDAFGEKFNVAATRRYTGLSSYRRLLEDDLDAVVIESPPYFHPEQAAAAVEAGRHVYLAKPAAVDAPGCATIAAAGKKATQKRQCFLVDFQTRAHPLYMEAVRRAHAGGIGPLVCGEAAYHDGRLATRGVGINEAETRLRNWVFDIALSGDIITEQNIHALDVATWIFDAAPVRAVGSGGRKARVDVGDCWDHFDVIYTFPGDLPLSFNSKQFGSGHSDILCRVYGANGTIDTHYNGPVEIRGENPYAGGSTHGIYTDGAATNIATFHDSITQGRFDNPTVEPSVRSNLTTILGRNAAYKGGETTWADMIEANHKLEADLRGLKT